MMKYVAYESTDTGIPTAAAVNIKTALSTDIIEYPNAYWSGLGIANKIPANPKAGFDSTLLLKAVDPVLLLIEGYNEATFFSGGILWGVDIKTGKKSHVIGRIPNIEVKVITFLSIFGHRALGFAGRTDNLVSIFYVDMKKPNSLRHITDVQELILF